MRKSRGERANRSERARGAGEGEEGEEARSDPPVESGSTVRDVRFTHWHSHELRDRPCRRSTLAPLQTDVHPPQTGVNPRQHENRSKLGKPEGPMPSAVNVSVGTHARNATHVERGAHANGNLPVVWLSHPVLRHTAELPDRTSASPPVPPRCSPRPEASPTLSACPCPSLPTHPG